MNRGNRRMTDAKAEELTVIDENENQAIDKQYGETSQAAEFPYEPEPFPPEYVGQHMIEQYYTNHPRIEEGSAYDYYHDTPEALASQQHHTGNLFARTPCEVINPDLVVGSQRAKAMKRLVAQRKKQRKLKKQGSLDKYPFLNFCSYGGPLHNLEDLTSNSDFSALAVKAEEIRKTIRLMEVAVQQKDKEKALILEVIEAKKKQYEDMQERLANPNEFQSDENKPTVNQPTVNQPSTEEPPKTTNTSARKRGRPPLDPCYPCPSKIKPTSTATNAEDEASSDGCFSDN